MSPFTMSPLLMNVPWKLVVPRLRKSLPLFTNVPMDCKTAAFLVVPAFTAMSSNTKSAFPRFARRGGTGAKAILHF